VKRIMPVDGITLPVCRYGDLGLSRFKGQLPLANTILPFIEGQRRGRDRFRTIGRPRFPIAGEPMKRVRGLRTTLQQVEPRCDRPLCGFTL
jgi:hypothetical protein